MIKLVLMLMVAEGVDAQLWHLDTPITASRHAASIQASHIPLREGEQWPLDKIMRAVAVISANDGAVAVAENLWGSEEAYLREANRRVLELGMIDTIVRSPNGLPPRPGSGRDFDMSTARDIAVLARECLKHPLIMDWVRTQEVVTRPGVAPRRNTNQLLRRMEDCDGLKTGFIRAAGFCIAATSVRDGIRLITVIMGNPVSSARFDQAQQLMEHGFSNVRRLQVVAKGQELGSPVPVSNSAVNHVRLRAKEDVWVTVRADDLENIKMTSAHPGSLLTPMTAGSVVGEVRVQLAGAVLARTPLYVPMDLEARNGPLTLTEKAIVGSDGPLLSAEPERTPAPRRRFFRRGS